MTKIMQITGKLSSFSQIFIFSLFFVVVAVVLLLLQFQLAYLNNQKELRNKTLRSDRYP